MAKQSGLGDNFYIDGNNPTGDIASLGAISVAHTPLEVTGIDKSGMERVRGARTGTMEFTAYFNPAAGGAHSRFSPQATTDKIASYFRGTTIGNSAASMVLKQLNYDGTRGADGSFTFAVQCLSNGYGLEWGQMLTAGRRTDTGATNGTSIDTAASASFGGQAYLHWSGFSGTDVTVKIQDSADDSSWLDVASFAFTQITTGSGSERIALSNTATIRRYVRVITVTTGGFTALTFAVNMVKNSFAGLVF